MTTTAAIPTVAGPIAATPETGLPFRGAVSPIGLDDPAVDDLLPPCGYVEEEFFVSGSVAGQPYKTTLLIRRPRDPARFSGLVALEPVHVQGGLGLWQTSHAAILEAGHVWVAVGSQRAGLEGPIRMSNPARYAGLTVPLPDPRGEDAIAQALSRWERSTSSDFPVDLFANDPVSNAIMTDVGALLKGVADAGGVLPGFAVRFLVMGGASQTGGATLNYIGQTGGDARLPDGRLIYDGFLPLSASGWEPVRAGKAAVIQIFAEGDLLLFQSIGAHGYLAARADSDAADDRYRCYQVNGAPHLPTRGLREAARLPQLGVALAPGERLNQFPIGPFYQGAFVNLVAWVMHAIVPPHAPAIEIVDGKIVTDELGNAQGGLRSPYVDVATVRYLPARYVRNLIGVELPLSRERLRALYKSRAAYLERFGRGIETLVAGRWISRADGERLRAEEAATVDF